MSDSVNRLKELLFEGERATLSELKRRLELLADTEHRARADINARLERLAESDERARSELIKTIETVLEAQRRQIGALTSTLDQVCARAGTTDQFRSSVATVLDGALREAEATRHDQLARALAPVVVRTIKTEFRNSQDDLVTALYPITGRMVKSYVASAIKDLMDEINRKLDSGIGQSAPVLRLRSLMTGRPVAELALASAQRLEITDMFLIRRGSGELLGRWPESHDLSNSDVHLSGVLTAISDFAQSAFQDDGGSIRSFSLDNAILFLRAAPTFLLVAKCKGTPTPGTESLIDEALLAAINQQLRPESVTGGAGPPLGAVATNLDTALSDRHARFRASTPSFNPLPALLMLLAIPLAGWLLWSIYTGFETTRTRSIAMRIVGSDETRLFRPEVDVRDRGREIRVTALAASDRARRDLMGELQAALPQTRIDDRITIMPGGLAEVAPELAAVRQTIAGLEGTALRTPLERTIGRARGRIQTALGDLALIPPARISATQQNTLREIGTTLTQSLHELGQTAQRVEGAGNDRTMLHDITQSLDDMAHRLGDAATALQSHISGDGSVAGAISQPGPRETMMATDALTIAAERVATLSMVAAQIARITPVERIVRQIEPPAASPRQQLEDTARTSAVFFESGHDYRVPAEAEAIIARVAELMLASDVLLRVVGYTDERGGAARNTSLAQSRAEKLAAELVRHGVPAERLVIVGRVNGPDLSARSGSGSPNRRVEFEVGFDGEAAVPQ